MNALTPTNNNFVVFFFPSMTSLFQAFVLQLAARKKNYNKSTGRRGYGMANKIISSCRRVALHCALIACEKKMK